MTNLELIRIEAGLTFKELADLSGINHSRLFRLEVNPSKLTIGECASLERVYQRTIYKKGAEEMKYLITFKGRKIGEDKKTYPIETVVTYDGPLTMWGIHEVLSKEYEQVTGITVGAAQ